MAYQEVRTTSYGTRVGNSLKGVVGGFVFLIAGTVLLWWNEGNAVANQKALEEASGACVPMESIEKVNSEFEGQLVHATGMATTTDTIGDSQFGIRSCAISIHRSVEYYQYKEKSHTEKRDKIGGGEEEITTYTYEKKWVSEPISSGSFHDPSYQNANFVYLQVSDDSFYAKNVSFGAYVLSDYQIHKIKSAEDMNLAIPTEIMESLNTTAANTVGAPVSNYVSRNSVAPAYNDSVQVNGVDFPYAHQIGNGVYIGRNPGAAEIGDVRITFKQVLPHKISIIAKPKGNTFTRFVAKSGKGLMFDVMDGVRTQDEMFKAEETANVLLLWALRFVGFLLVYFGLKGVFEILVTIFKVLPFLADIVNIGVSLVCGVVAFAWSLIIIAIAWLFYRPLLAICILVAVAGVIFFFVKRGKKKGPQQPQGPQGPMGGDQMNTAQQQPYQQQAPQQPAEEGGLKGFIKKATQAATAVANQMNQQNGQYQQYPNQQPYQQQPGQYQQYPNQQPYQQQPGQYPQQPQYPNQQPYQQQPGQYPQQPQYPNQQPYQQQPGQYPQQPQYPNQQPYQQQPGQYPQQPQYPNQQPYQQQPGQYPQQPQYPNQQPYQQQPGQYPQQPQYPNQNN